MIKKHFFLYLFLVPLVTQSQNLRRINIQPSDNGKIYSEFLQEVEDRENVNIVFNEQKLRARTVRGIEFSNTDFYKFLERSLKIANFNVVRLEDDLAIIAGMDISESYGTRKENYAVLQGIPGQEVTIKGTVLDKSINEPIIGTQVFITGSNIGAVTDINGNFSFKTNARILELNINFIGFEKKSMVVGFHPQATKSTIDVDLYPESQQLETVIVTAKGADQNIRSKLTGVERMGIESIKTLPTFLGEVDPIKSMTTLPGVSTVGELSSGFNVRGGEAGQNLILQDNATIYNPSHLFGFFSAFNPDLVNNVVLYKGGGPSEYGSRIASIMDVTLRNGDAGRFEASGGVGLVSSRLTVEAPIIKGKSSFIVGGRVSYIDWLLNATNNIELKQSSAQFYDLTGKIFHTVNEKNFITFSFYNSYDDFNFTSDSIFSWQTTNASLLWDQTINEKLYGSLSLASSNYSSRLDNKDEVQGFKYVNKINNLRFKYKLNYDKSEDLSFSGGIEAVGIVLEPGKLDPLEADNNVVPANMQNQNSIETAGFIQSDISITSDWSVSVGLRYSHFFRLGPDDIYSFDFNNIVNRYPTINDTIHYKGGNLIEYFSGFEPRLSMRYLISDELSLKASYFRTFQYLHLISNTASTTPQDYWVTSGPYLKPGIGDQFSLGLFKNFNDDVNETSVEGFYKTTESAVDYIEGADITLNPSLEAGLVQGEAKAYGLEFLLKKNTGKFNGWISYTYSRSMRKFDGETDLTTINDGNYYPSNFDQPHNLSIVSNIEFNQQVSLSFNFGYSTGRPITIPVSKFSYGPYLSVLNYSERNEYRIPDYHRLDLSLTIKDDPIINRRYSGEWVFSIYNLYGRKNAYSITFNRYGRAKKLSVLGSIFPSLTYNFKF
ncbi:MAG: TonB-dependent receptor [Bacteroidetes bacterium]|nr:MAG: TonB-dependent receptor [Bacteroidota bacterium]